MKWFLEGISPSEVRYYIAILVWMFIVIRMGHPDIVLLVAGIEMVLSKHRVICRIDRFTDQK